MVVLEINYKHHHFHSHFYHWLDKCFFCAKHYSKQVVCIHMLIPHNNPTRAIRLLFLFSRGENEVQRGNSFPKGTQLINPGNQSPAPPLFASYCIASWYIKTRASQVAQWWRIRLPIEETWVRSLSQEDPLEKEMATTPVFLPGKSHGRRSLEGYSWWGHKDLDMTRLLSTLIKM